jgi:hypothetical protein
VPLVEYDKCQIVRATGVRLETRYVRSCETSNCMKDSNRENRLERVRHWTLLRSPVARGLRGDMDPTPWHKAYTLLSEILQLLDLDRRSIRKPAKNFGVWS